MQTLFDRGNSAMVEAIATAPDYKRAGLLGLDVAWKRLTYGLRNSRQGAGDDLINVEITGDRRLALLPRVHFHTSGLAKRGVRQSHAESAQSFAAVESCRPSEAQRFRQCLGVHTGAVIQNRDLEVIPVCRLPDTDIDTPGGCFQRVVD